jgi:hypothetical protein
MLDNCDGMALLENVNRYALLFSAPLFHLYCFSMCLTNTRKWRVLCWNVRGLNSKARQRAVRSKIEESNYSIIYLQKTKCASFDHKFIRKFCPKRFDCFAFVPSYGASGGILVIWNSAIFTGTL